MISRDILHNMARIADIQFINQSLNVQSTRVYLQPQSYSRQPQHCLKIATFTYFTGLSCFRNLSISNWVCPVALDRNTSSALTSFARNASSPALVTMPHRTHMSMRSAGERLVHLGIKREATFELPADRHSLKNGYQENLAVFQNQRNELKMPTCHPIGDFFVFPHSSISPQSLFATRARKRSHQNRFSGILNSLFTLFAREE